MGGVVVVLEDVFFTFFFLFLIFYFFNLIYFSMKYEMNEKNGNIKRKTVS